MTAQRPLVVIIDDETLIVDVLGRLARRAGFEVEAFASWREALDYLPSHRADLALVDMRMPELGAVDVLRMIQGLDPQCQTLLLTGSASVETAVEAIKAGALEYLSKPLDFARLDEVLRTVRDDVERRRRVLQAEGDVARSLEFCGMIGRSPIMQDLFGLIRRLAPHVRTALITGETGTGKELVARALHSLGPRRDRRFVTVNCSAVVETLFEAADGGTLFLDDIGELPLALQDRLLRVLETGDVTRVGSLEPRRVNVQLLAATNRDLHAEVSAGRFRRDLYYRLNIVEVWLPPLRDRREDVPYLTAAFVREAAERLPKPLTGLTAGAERLVASTPWHGNVRELRHVIERACILSEREFITERELEQSLLPPGRQHHGSLRHAPSLSANPALLTTVERDHIQRALERAGGNKKAAAQILGLSRRALYRRLERLDLGETITRRPFRDAWPTELTANS